MAKVVVSGATGFIGSALVSVLRARGDDVVRLVRSAPREFSDVVWTPGETLDPAVLDGAAAVVNLAGASIGRLPWTPKWKKDILASRLASTGTIVRALKANPGPALVNASAVGFYGNRGDSMLTESSSTGTGYLAEVTRKWEAAALEASSVARVALPRTGLVIGDGGALDKLRLLTKLYAGGPLGGGRQWWPWISLRDEVSALIHLIDNNIDGPVNLAGPMAATMNEIGRELARSLNRPYWLPAPAFALGLVLGQGGKELLLSSQRVVPERLEHTGFIFQDRDVASAIAAS